MDNNFKFSEIDEELQTHFRTLFLIDGLSVIILTTLCIFIKQYILAIVVPVMGAAYALTVFYKIRECIKGNVWIVEGTVVESYTPPRGRLRKGVGALRGDQLRSYITFENKDKHLFKIYLSGTSNQFGIGNVVEAYVNKKCFRQKAENFYNITSYYHMRNKYIAPSATASTAATAEKPKKSKLRAMFTRKEG